MCFLPCMAELLCLQCGCRLGCPRSDDDGGWLVCDAVCGGQPTLRGYADPLTAAMVEVYQKNQGKFTAEMHPHYIYSPRELSKWTRALYEGLQPLEGANLEDLVRLWLHEVC
jgi:hypothetical protein